MVSTKACIATCVIDGFAVTLTFFPDTGVLRITDAAGTRLRETTWNSSWQSLIATFQELSGATAENREDRDALFNSAVSRVKCNGGVSV